jgi:DedD protein
MSAGQVVLVTFGFLIASFLVFIFGMWVGKDIAERRLAQEERVFRAPVARPTAAAAPEAVAGAASAPASGGAQALVPHGTPSPLFQLPLDAPRSPTPVPLQATPTPTIHLVVLTPATTARTTPRMPPTPAQTGEEWADAGWTVQVTATTDAANAEAIAARLRSRGYDAYTIKAPNRGQIWYRVRVGRYASRAEAQQIESRLKTSESLSAAFVTAR